MTPREITARLTPQEKHELKHRLAECQKAADWYRGTPRESEMSDVIYLYETVALLGRAVAAALREAET